MASKRKYTKKSEYWNKFGKASSIEETLANNPLLQNSTYSPSIEGEPYIGSTAKEWKELFIDGTANIDTLSLTDGFTYGGVTFNENSRSKHIT